MNKKKLSFGLLFFVICFFAFSITPYATTHYGTYDMKGGIFYAKAFKKGTKLDISVDPVQGSPNCPMGIFTAKKTFFGWRGIDSIADVSSVEYSSTTYTTKKNIDGIYFRDWAGVRWTGSFSVSW